MARVRTTLSKSGPFFAADPAKTFRANTEDLLAVIAAEGEGETKSLAGAVSPGAGGTGAFREGILGRNRRLDGRPFKKPMATVSQRYVYPWKNGGPKQYRGGKLEASRHVFRTASRRLNAGGRLNAGQLLRGIQ